MENLKALVYKGDLTPYQRALAKREFEGIIERLEIYEKLVKNNAVLPNVSVAKYPLPRPLEAWKAAREMDCGDYCDWHLEQERRGNAR